MLIALKTIKSYRTSLLAICTLAIGLGALVPVTYFPLPENALPEEFYALFKSEGTLIFSEGLEQYISIIFRHPLVLISFSAFAITVASRAIGGEIERKTIFILLSRPIPRYKLLLYRWLAMIPGIALLGGSLVVGIGIGLIASDPEENVLFSRYLVAWGSLSMLLLAIGSYSFLISTLASDGTKSLLLSSSFTLIFYLIDFVAEIWEPLEFLGPISVFYYYDPVTTVVNGSLITEDVFVLFGLSLISLILSLVAFQVRDIK